MATHLERRLLRRVSRLNRAFDLIEAGDRIMVACSGGKDSWALLHLLRAYQSMVPFDFEIVAMNLDQGHPGFPAQVLVDHFTAHGFEHRMVFQDTYSVVLDKVPEGKTTCSLCSRLRRGVLYRVAGELGATKIALGHHRDDAIETLLLNMFFAGQLKSMPPKLRSDDGRNTIIRPLAYCAESDLAAYATECQVPIVPCDLCGSQENLQRKRMKALLTTLEADNPRIRESMLASMSHIVPSHLFVSQQDGSPASADVPLLRVLSSAELGD
jgi:tRNA 2-thiocytidine biosynthesis protein TtcA